MNTLTIYDNPETINNITRIAEIMAQSKVSIPKAFQGNPGDCFAVCVTAARFGLDGMAIINDTYVINGNVSFSAKLIHGLLRRSGVVDNDSIEYKFEGEGDNLKCTVSAKFTDSEKVKELTCHIPKGAKKGNSPLWITNPHQQMRYFTMRAWVRAYAPDVLLGISAPEDIYTTEPKNITPQQQESRDIINSRIENNEQETIDTAPDVEVVEGEVVIEHVEKISDDAIEIASRMCQAITVQALEKNIERDKDFIDTLKDHEKKYLRNVFASHKKELESN